MAYAILLHGSREDRLGWIFDLYDINKDGTLTKVVCKKKIS